jgi:prefoldin subunit 2
MAIQLPLYKLHFIALQVSVSFTPDLLIFIYVIARLVIDAVSGLDAGRRCYRLVGGVLVERTVGEVLPAVRKNLEGVRPPHSYPLSLLVAHAHAHAPPHAHSHPQLTTLVFCCAVPCEYVQIEQILKTLNASLLQKDKALNEFKVQHKIRVMGEDEDEAPAPQAKSSSSSSSGVLV